MKLLYVTLISLLIYRRETSQILFCYNVIQRSFWQNYAVYATHTLTTPAPPHENTISYIGAKFLGRESITDNLCTLKICINLLMKSRHCPPDLLVNTQCHIVSRFHTCAQGVYKILYFVLAHYQSLRRQRSWILWTIHTSRIQRIKSINIDTAMAKVLVVIELVRPVPTQRERGR